MDRALRADVRELTLIFLSHLRQSSGMSSDRTLIRLIETGDVPSPGGTIDGAPDRIRSRIGKFSFRMNGRHLLTGLLAHSYRQNVFAASCYCSLADKEFSNGPGRQRKIDYRFIGRESTRGCSESFSKTVSLEYFFFSF